MKLEMPRFDQAQVLVLGDIMLDRYWEGGTSRISPEAPVPVVKVEQISDRPGGAGNVALNIAALGAGAQLCGYTGDDEMADSLEDMLAGAGVHCGFTRVPGHPTITKLRVISRHQQLIRLDFEEPGLSGAGAPLTDSLTQLLPHCGVLVLSDYAKGALGDPEPLIAAAREAGVPVLVDPKGTDFARYRGATLLTPNFHEFETVVGPCPSEAELVERGEQLMSELSLQALLVTRGEQGMTLLRPGEEELHLPARAREVFDVTGAGDTVIAVLASAIAAGAALPEAVALANIAASIVVGKLGTATVSGPELRRAVQQDQGSERGAVTLEQLQIAVADARSHGEKVVFTNGCFDIIHAGHISYLEEARQQGDRLIVAVNSDDSVRRLKGKGRPINAVERRMAVLAGLEAVDWVVSFADDTPRSLLQALKPDVLVKGGDYVDKEAVVGWEIVEAYGGEVRVLSVVDNLSTTAIVSRIQQGE
ncbi:bifunctional D-glycero-beta-D-manno-heptose-7-phosphate kinase/D-glycero-beta-D-manno-heptose 1-phosphate adenylyltransferase HldE [Pseudohalioglobus lutimaris]|uniref:Bifunctional protein HldE n=1 Tax=Pseudohalioglobus lutimaris TaxID=1737061 RepID=A0A2N5X8L5_9GAMM|nr:bifunctional D-glycero-beta-D-manno-heptose-7-phosphate kinase/D-glycero-beta-D-manno-heptose 1-phosphate adenylyltransferase HldE [Pseudohalioglobus lutimaris]PLW70816.1 bifunctional D-glycero-beta-D-manno-heptose-7-phosphate kinase/D-glycero-beta-D-manno-heptose 1-phosphate adenylyltransferase HldE [Pseudohalioglobus lutimaris]